MWQHSASRGCRPPYVSGCLSIIIIDWLIEMRSWILYLWWSPELWDLFCTSFDLVVCTRLELYYDFIYRFIILCLSYLATWLSWLPFLNKPIDDWWWWTERRENRVSGSRAVSGHSRKRLSGNGAWSGAGRSESVSGVNHCCTQHTLPNTPQWRNSTLS